MSKAATILVDPARQVDLIARAFTALKKKCGFPKGKSFRNLRQVGATAIRNHYKPNGGCTKTNSELFDMFLAHKEPDVVRAYDDPVFDELYKATDWLGEYLGLSTPVDIPAYVDPQTGKPKRRKSVGS